MEHNQNMIALLPVNRQRPKWSNFMTILDFFISRDCLYY